MSPPLATSQVRYLTTQDVAERYRTAQSTIRYWRHVGYGPKGIKVGRRVLYQEAEIERFERHLAATATTPDNSGDAEGKLPGLLDAADRVTSHHQR